MSIHMGLQADIAALADLLPPSHIPAPGEVARVVGAIAAYAEHGPAILKAASEGADALAAELGKGVESEYGKLRYTAQTGLPYPEPGTAAAPVQAMSKQPAETANIGLEGATVEELQAALADRGIYATPETQPAATAAMPTQPAVSSTPNMFAATPPAGA